MPNFVYIATSLDGFIATPDGGLDWLFGIPNPDQSDYGYAEFIEKMDAVVMGRKTYEKVLIFNDWPYPVPVFVFSHSHIEIPEALKGKVEIVIGEPYKVVEELIAQGYCNLYIDGGKLIQSFLQEDLH
ncbi:MAG: bifunctional deaminase-reductase domain-containing protein [Chloroflexi bacterium]|nr:MAG: bifunctional deaminase-reductase domain-containing protein [Chloroflexota bacterium]